MSRRLRLISLVCMPVVLGLGLAGCITRPPASVDPRVAGQWHAPMPHGGSLASLADWWRQLDDPLLVELIAAAEAASPNVASAAARVAEARSTRVQSGAALLPSLDGNFTATRGNSSISAPTGGTSITAAPLTTLQAGLQSRWELDLFGRLRADRDAAIARHDSANAKWHDARVSVAAETANAYFAERACQEQLRVSESDTRSRAESARLTELSAGAGFASPGDAALARASASDASGRFTQQRAQCAVQRKALVALSAIDEDTLTRKLAAAPTQRVLPEIGSIASVPAEAIAQRPDVFSAELAVAAASAEVGSAEAERYPKLSITGSIGRSQYRSDGQHQSLENWTVGPISLTVPLLDGGSRVANVDAAKARYAEAVSLYRANVRQAVREVEEALINLEATAGRTGDADTAVKNYQASFNATQARYDGGLASQFELEDARRTLFAAQTARVSLQRERTEAWVALYRSMGGGWSRPAEGTEMAGPPPPPAEPVARAKPKNAVARAKPRGTPLSPKTSTPTTKVATTP